MSIDKNKYLLKHSENYINSDLWIDPKNFSISKLMIYDKNIAKQLIAEFSDHKKIMDNNIPQNIKVTLKSLDINSEIRLQYSNIAINKPDKLFFNISSKYKKIQL